MLKFFKRKNKLPDSFCIAPFVQMDLNEQGHVNACCKAKDVLGFWSKEKISEIWNNIPIKKIRHDFITGKKPKGCKSCWDDEALGKFSRRQDYNLKFQKEIETLQELIQRKSVENATSRPLVFSGLDIGFSAQCTLRCRMCGPSASSSWLSKALDNKEIYNYYAELGELNPQIIETRFKDFLSDDLFQDFCEKIAPNVGDLMINGGEPLASRHHFLFFANPNEKYLSNLKVSLTTNAQTIFFKDHNLIPYWSKLKAFNYRVSVDNVHQKYSYIRNGASFEKLKQNVKNVHEGFNHDQSKLRVIFTVAVSLYNIADLIEIIRESIKCGATIHMNWVQFPQFLSIKNTPQTLASRIVDDIEEFLAQVKGLHEWNQHPLWSKEFKTFPDYESLQRTLQFAQEDYELKTFKDFAILRIREELLEVQKFLAANAIFEKFSQDFISHVQLMDRTFQTNYLDFFPENERFL